MRKILIFIAVPVSIIILAITLAYTFYPQIPMVIMAKMLNKKSNDITPTTHIITTKDIKTGKTYTYDRVSITTDWIEKNITDINISKIIAFENDAILMLNNEKMNINLYDTLKEELSKKQLNQNIDKYFANIKAKSNEDLYVKMLNTTSKDINLKQSRDELSIQLILLPLKKAMIGDTTEILEYAINGYTFYQIKVEADKYAINFFDDTDTQHTIFLKKPGITQNEIDSLVKTITVSQ